MKKYLKYIPNTLSMARIPLSLAFFFVAKDYPAAFIVLFLLAGACDFFDGFLARKYGWATKLGSLMDSIGDLVFITCIITCVVLFVPGLSFERHTMVCLGVMAAIRVFNMIFIMFKFKKFGFIHNLASKYSAFPIFCLALYVIPAKEIPHVFLSILICIVALAAIEETLILTQMKEFDMDMKSIYHMVKQNKTQEEGTA